MSDTPNTEASILVQQVVGDRRGKPGQLQKEVAEALIPIMLKYRKEFGNLDQVAGCALIAAERSINLAVHGPPSKTIWT